MTIETLSPCVRRPFRHGFRPALPLLALLVTGCTFPGEADLQSHEAAVRQSDDFETLYAKNCSGCHGADGRMGPAPPLNDPLFLSIVPTGVLEGVIRDGRPGTLMPAFSEEKGGTLNSRQVSRLANGLRSHWLPGGSKGDHLPPYLASANRRQSTTTPAQGGALFARACAGCHGSKGEGDTAGPIADPAFLALLSDQALRRLIITGRPDLGMPNYAEKHGRDDDFRPLTSEEIQDLVAFVRHLGKAMPATARHDHRGRRVLLSSAAARRGASN
jgi:cytochrome c oxidase cbb3-type subunit III